MRDGIYKVTLEAGDNKGLMIGALHGGHLTGCDQSHFVTGRFTRRGNHIRGTFQMKRHSRRPDFREFANLDDFEVRFAGICGDSFGQFDATVPAKPGLKVKAVFRWICEN